MTDEEIESYEILPLTDEEIESYESQKVSHVCKQKFYDVDDKSHSNDDRNDKEFDPKNFHGDGMKFMMVIVMAKMWNMIPENFMRLAM